MTHARSSPERSPHDVPYDAIVLAGGASRRFGSDKLGVLVEGVPLLDRALLAVSEAERRVVVGPRRVTAVDVEWVREEPPGSGPANAVAAGLRRCAAPYVVLLAGDLPYVAAGTVDRLLGAIAADRDFAGAMLVDDGGRTQQLCSAWHRDALEGASARRPDWVDVSMRTLVEPLRVSQIASSGREARDIDRPEDITSDP
ncbi:molybdenum cofactor guanylyltransferase [Mumia sp. zg.B17]|uniref:molybdenum cofactor guanylyltransferase n=1 Tax=Mumia sp. zg.B17 TaxID=2855446 RepID=UPI001C6E6105|nr:molybdenum cofactor guanylyltransferase [Mumia sp. zg.B17]MBW9207589.1 molybdenum cofactor guanylyltransferase [Mumia sp. zg.B17]